MNDRPLPCQFITYLNKVKNISFSEFDMLHNMRGDYDIPDFYRKTFITEHELFFYFQDYKKYTFKNAMTALMFYYPVVSWRPTQDIIQFSETISEEIKYTKLDKKLPTDIFYSFPAWQLYFNIPDLYIYERKWDGFFAGLDVTINGLPMVTITFLNNDFSGKTPIIRRLPISVEGTIQDAFDLLNEARGNINIHEKLKIDENIFYVLNAILYVCTYGLNGGTVPVTTKPEFPMPRKTKKGWRIFPPDKPRIHVLGKEFGDMIRKAESTYTPGTGTSKRPHVRRAHWHSYWTGARQDADNRKLIVKWLHPMIIGGLDQCQNEN